jgi:hypothetical protein
MGVQSQSNPARIQRHLEIAAELAGWDDEALLRRLADAGVGKVGHGPMTLEKGSRVFAKLVPVTATELRPENRRSTANLFQLPTCYQYRMGGCGFGAWRELQVHDLVSEWVISGARAQFALLHHWRVLPMVPERHDDKVSLQPWGDCKQIAKRVSAVIDASASIVLFLELFPATLGQWLGARLRDTVVPVALVSNIETRLVDLLEFSRNNGLIHMDAHFENILTDGSELYLSDHGLAMSPEFDLSADERSFLRGHQEFDISTALNSLIHAVVSHYHPDDAWRDVLRRLQQGDSSAAGRFPADVRAYLLRRAPIALEMGEFWGRLIADLTTRFPDDDFRKLLDGCVAGAEANRP